MTTTEIALIESGGFTALNHTADEIAGFILDNLDGQDITPSDLTRITVPSGKATKYRWEIPTLDGSESVEEISGIIVHKTRARGYWPLSIDEGGGGQPPICQSPDAVTGFGKQWASKADPDPEGEPVTCACADCPQSSFGSDGARGQACSETAPLFLLGETGFLPTLINVPPTSLGRLKKYMLQLANVGIRYDQVVTVFALEKVANSGGVEYAQIAPRLGGRLDPDAAARARAYGTMLKPAFTRAAAEQATATP